MRRVTTPGGCAGTAALAGLLGLLLAPPCAALPVETSRKAGVDYSAFQTYAWQARAEKDPGHPLAEGSVLDGRIRAAGDRALAANGLRRVDPGREAPDLWIAYTGIVEDTLIVEGVERKIAEGVSWIGHPHAHSMRAFQTGTLVVEILDAESGEPVWSGWVSGVADSIERLRKKAEKAARRILHHFPPR